MGLRGFPTSSVKHHILAALVIVCGAALLFYQHVFCDGMLFYCDMDFTDPPFRNLELRLSAWDMYGSYATIPHLQRLPWLCLFIVPSLVFNLSTRAFVHLLFVGTLSLVGLNMYVMTYTLVRKLFGKSPPAITVIGSLIAAFVYMFNPVAIQHYWAFWVTPSYSFLPLLPLMAERLFRTPTLSEVAVCSLAMTLFLTSPQFIVWSFPLYGAMYGFFFVTTKATLKMSLRRFVAIVGVVAAYLLLNAYWLLLYFASGAPSPSYYTVSPGMVRWLSGDTVNIWRLTGASSRFLIEPSFVGIDGSGMSLWRLMPLVRDPMAVTSPMWIVGGFVLSIVAGTAFLRGDIRRKRYLVFFGLVLIVSVLLAQGAKSIVPIYELLFQIPVIRNISWVFRAPARFEFFTALCLAFLSSIAVIGFLIDIRAMSRRTRLLCSSILVLLMIAVGYYFYPVVKFHADTIYKPADIPEDYQTIRQWLSDRSGKVTWFPSDTQGGLIPTWDITKRYNVNLIWLVEHPTIATYLSGRNMSFFRAIEAMIIEQDYIPFDDILAILGSRYAIFDESAMPTTHTGYVDYVITSRQKLLSDPELQIVFQTEYLTVFENRSFAGEVFTSDGMVIIDSLDELSEMSEMRVNDFVPVLREDIQQLPLPASLTPDGQYVSCAQVGESHLTYYRHLSPTAYEVFVHTDKPFLLVVSESYDPLWTAVVNDEKEYSSIPVSGIVNGYWIEETGELEIRVEYQGQRAFTQGGRLSLFTAILLGTYWMYKKLSQLWKGYRQRSL